MKVEWESVNSKLPEYDKDVLIFCGKNETIIARLLLSCICGDVDHFSDGTWCGNLDIVTHWMFLPKSPAPKEGKIKYAKPKKPLNKEFNSSLKKPNSFKFW